MAETVNVTLPRVVEIYDAKLKKTHRIDLTKAADPERIARACLYKFGGVLDAHAAEKDATKAGEKADKRIKAILGEGDWSKSGGPRVDPISREFGRRVKAILGDGLDEKALDVARAVEADQGAALKRYGMALAVRYKGKDARAADAKAAADALWHKATDEVVFQKLREQSMATDLDEVFGNEADAG